MSIWSHTRATMIKITLADTYEILIIKQKACFSGSCVPVLRMADLKRCCSKRCGENKQGAEGAAPHPYSRKLPQYLFID